MKVKVTVDRIEKNLAVLLIRPKEDERINWPLKFLPDDIKEGDILDIKIDKDLKTKEDSKERVGNLIEKLKRKNKEN